MAKAGNPYETDAPEWQLWENMNGASLAARAEQDNADRAIKKASELRAKAERYERVLAILEAAKES